MAWGEMTCALHDWEGWGEKGKGNHMQHLRSRVLGRCAATQLAAAWMWRADDPCPSPPGCGF